MHIETKNSFKEINRGNEHYFENKINFVVMIFCLTSKLKGLWMHIEIKSYLKKINHGNEHYFEN